jgi:hypothetical protein
MTLDFDKIRESVKHLRGKKLTEPELRQLSTLEILALCECDIQIPGPVVVDPNCPVHWDLAKDGKPTILGDKPVEKKA